MYWPEPAVIHCPWRPYRSRRRRGNFFKLSGNSRARKIVPACASKGEKSLVASVSSPPPPPDAAVLNRVQQDNQRQLVGKLLHDLRNPVHSIRISMELFGRLARRNGDVDKLMERAAQYIDPAEAAVASLVANSERLSRYVAAAAQPETQTLAVDEVLSEVTSLLRAAKRRMQVTTSLPEPPVAAVRADRMRLCHVLLHSCLNNAASTVAIAIRPANGIVVFDLAFQAAAVDAVRAIALSAEDLRLIVETAGGALIASSDAGLTLEFRQASDPSPG